MKTSEATSEIFHSYRDGTDEDVLDYGGRPYASVALDYDGDQDLDLALTQYPGAAILYENSGIRGNGAADLRNVSNVAFPSQAEPPQNGRGVAAVDYDKQNGVDLLFTAPGATAQDAPRLYQNQGDGTFRDFIAEMDVSHPTEAAALRSALADSWVGAWGDYDNDTYPDLFVGRAASDPFAPPHSNHLALNRLPPALFRNEGGAFFTDQSAPTASGILEDDGFGNPDDAGIACVAAAWGDIDQDGFVDLVAGSMIPLISGRESRLYMNQGDGTFVEEWATVIGNHLGVVSSVQFGDLNSGIDPYPDLVVGVREAASAGPFVFMNEGGSLTQVNLGAGIAPTNVLLVDQDYDGRLDLLVLPDSTSSNSESPVLFRNLSRDGNAEFVRQNGIGLETPGGVFGVTLADFDGDTIDDLFLGRRVVSEAYYYKSTDQATAAGAIANPTVQVSLQGGGGNAPDGLGAVVALKDGGVTRARHYAGSGAGRGGQVSPSITLGMGDGPGPFEIEVTWPDGGSQTIPVAPGQTYSLQDATSPSVVASTQSASVTLSPGAFTVEVTWETEHASRAENDELHIIAATNGCLSVPTVIQASDPGVVHSITRLNSGRFLHTLRKENMTCVGKCTYTYYCASATDFVTSTGANAPKTFKTALCIGQ